MYVSFFGLFPFFCYFFRTRKLLHDYLFSNYIKIGKVDVNFLEKLQTEKKNLHTEILMWGELIINLDMLKVKVKKIV